jgi:hypothetical protein
MSEWFLNYRVGVCLAIRKLVGDEKFKKEFGATTIDDALRKCTGIRRDSDQNNQFVKFAHYLFI